MEQLVLVGESNEWNEIIGTSPKKEVARAYNKVLDLHPLQTNLGIPQPANINL